MVKEGISSKDPESLKEEVLKSQSMTKFMKKYWELYYYYRKSWVEKHRNILLRKNKKENEQQITQENKNNKGTEIQKGFFV